MYPISESAKARFLSGQKQIARLTVNNNPYEPYKEEFYFSHFTVDGENIFTRENETDGKYLNSSGGYTNNQNFAVSDYLEIEPQKRYVIADGDHGTATGVYYAWYDATKTFIRSEQWNQEFFISPSNAKYLRVSYRPDRAPTSLHIEVGIVPHGTVDVATGVLTQDYAYISDLSHYNYSASMDVIYYTYPLSGAYSPATNPERLTGIASSGYRISLVQALNLTMTPYSMARANGRLYFRNDDYSGVTADFKDSMVGIEAIYELKEPCVYQITPEQVKTFLGVNHISSNTGEVEVTYRNTSGEYVTVSGDTATFTDGAKDVPVQSLSTAISYTQDLNGYDYPWVGGGGKNKYDNSIASVTKPSWYTGTWSGSSFNNQNGITQTRTWNDGGAGGFSLPSLPSGTYTVSMGVFDATRTYRCHITVTTTGSDMSVVVNNLIMTISGSRAYISFTVPANMGVAIRPTTVGALPSGTTSYDFTDIQIEQGSSATDYTPYENICPIEGRTNATIHQTGKNMFNGYYFNGYYDNNGNFRQSDYCVGVYFEDIYTDNNLIVEGGQDYTICFDTIGIRGKDFYTLEFDKETGEYIRGTKTLRYTQQAGKTIPRRITIRPSFSSILVWYWDSGREDEYDAEEFNDITMVTLPSQILEDVVIRESDIVEGSLSVNRYCTTGKSAMIGSCVASEMNVILNNENGNYNDVNFIGKDISVEVGTLDANDTPDFMPVGIFQVDDSPKKLEHISITALDRMMLLEKPLENLPYPTIVRYLYEDICSRTNVRRKTTELWNESYVIDTPPENLQTYRDALSCLCEITGTCAYFDWDGRLCLEWFSSEEPTIELTTANRIVSDLAEESVQITGVEVKAGEETYLAGTDAYTLSVAQNPLVTHDAQALADALYGHLGWLSYRPFTATVLPMPYVYPMDMATFVDKDGNESLVAITDWTFRLNRNTELRGRGESSQQASFKKKYGIGENGADIDEALGILRDTIIKNAEIINQQMETIERTLHGQYEALSSEFGSYRNETDAKITANAEGITQAYTNIEEIDSKYGVAITDTNQAIVQVADGAVATNTKFREVTEAYIKSGKLYYEGMTPVYGVAVGQLTYEMIGGEQLIKRSGVYSVFTSDELAFYIDDVKVAYMKNKKLYINEAEFVSAINVGRYKLEDGANGFTIKYGG